MQANLGNVNRQLLFGFTQPYFHNRPLNLGFQVFDTKSDYNAAKATSTTAGASANLTAAQQSLLQNYNNSTVGLNASASYPLPRHNFQRVGYYVFAHEVVDYRIQYRIAEPFPDD